MSKRIDDLIAESQKLRDELLRTASKLDAFSTQLASAIQNMGDGDGNAKRGDSTNTDRED